MRVDLRHVVVVVAVGAASVGVGLLPATAAPSAYTFHKINVPRAGKPCPDVMANSINDHGVVVGQVLCGTGRGFIRSAAGKLTLFRAPGPATEATAGDVIASNGIVAVAATRGDTSKDTVRYSSFLRSPTGKYTPLKDPSAGRAGTYVLSVNAAGVAVGVYYPGATTKVVKSFVYRHGHFSDFTLPISGAVSPNLTTINNKGEKGGYYTDAAGAYHAFLVKNGKSTVVNAPGAGTTPGTGTLLSDVANNGSFAVAVYGNHSTGTSAVNRNGHYRTVAVPTSYDSDFTVCQGINRTGDIAGVFYDNKGVAHSFLAQLN